MHNLKFFLEKFEKEPCGKGAEVNSEKKDMGNNHFIKEINLGDKIRDQKSIPDKTKNNNEFAQIKSSETIYVN